VAMVGEGAGVAGRVLLGQEVGPVAADEEDATGDLPGRARSIIAAATPPRTLRR
jgi:hypothetical protein